MNVEYRYVEEVKVGQIRQFQDDKYIVLFIAGSSVMLQLISDKNIRVWVKAVLENDPVIAECRLNAKNRTESR